MHMASIVFYEKPGCGNNTRQKTLLAAAGHTVLARNILVEAWTPLRLRPFFGELPVAQWFNPSAPRVKSGEIDPARLNEDEALLHMVADPLLIRRPLMEVDGEYRAGFELMEVDQWVGLPGLLPAQDMESCRKSAGAPPCPAPAPQARADS